MTSAKPFRVLIERSGRDPYELVLQSKAIMIDGVERTIYFFKREGVVDAEPRGFVVNESPRQGLSLDDQVKVALAMVRVSGMHPDDAARAAAMLKARVEGLIVAQAEQLVRQIRDRMADEGV